MSFLLAVANENVSLVISRQILSEFCSNFLTLPDDVGKVVAHFTLDKVQPRVVSFEEQVLNGILVCMELSSDAHFMNYDKIGIITLLICSDILVACYCPKYLPGIVTFMSFFIVYDTIL